MVWGGGGGGGGVVGDLNYGFTFVAKGLLRMLFCRTHC